MTVMSSESPKKSFDDRLSAYADLLVRVGLNVQPGQKAVVRADVDSAPLVRKVVEAAYRAGSPYVEVMFSDDAVTRTRFLSGPEGSFDIIPEWRAEGMIRLAQEGAAALAIVSDDPDLLAIGPDKSDLRDADAVVDARIANVVLLCFRCCSVMCSSRVRATAEPVSHVAHIAMGRGATVRYR